MAYQFACTFYVESVPVIIVKTRGHFRLSVQNSKNKISVLKPIQSKWVLSIMLVDLSILLITSPGTNSISKNLLRPDPDKDFLMLFQWDQVTRMQNLVPV